MVIQQLIGLKQISLPPIVVPYVSHNHSGCSGRGSMTIEMDDQSGFGGDANDRNRNQGEQSAPAAQAAQAAQAASAATMREDSVDSPQPSGPGASGDAQPYGHADAAEEVTLDFDYDEDVPGFETSASDCLNRA